MLRGTANDRRPAARPSCSRAALAEWTQSRTRKTETHDRGRIATGAPGGRSGVLANHIKTIPFGDEAACGERFLSARMSMLAATKRTCHPFQCMLTVA